MILLLSSVKAWFDGDFIKVVFVLTPLIKSALREFVRKLGIPVNKKHPIMPGREVPLNIGDMLSKAVVKDALGEDLTFYYRLMFSDSRGRNLRNLLAHGQLRDTDITYEVANLLSNSMLVIGTIDRLAPNRKSKEKGDGSIKHQVNRDVPQNLFSAQATRHKRQSLLPEVRILD